MEAAENRLGQSTAGIQVTSLIAVTGDLKDSLQVRYADIGRVPLHLCLQSRH